MKVAISKWNYSPAVLLALCLCAVVFGTSTSALAQSPAYEPRPYHPSQLLDGFGAILIAPAEPVLVTMDYAKGCSRDGYSGLEATGCGVGGFLISPLYLIRDVFAGAGDILTFGYFRLSRKAGVFDYFQ